jgi:hypothetical protein
MEISKEILSGSGLSLTNNNSIKVKIDLVEGP